MTHRIRSIRNALRALSFASVGGLLLVSGAWTSPVVPRGATRAVAPRMDVPVIGVLPFQVDAGDTTLSALAFAMPDLLTTDLARSARLTLVERARLGSVLREFQLAGTGVVDPATAPRLGRMLQAGRLVTGTLSRVPGGDVRFEARITDVMTGRIDTAIVATAPLNDVLAAEKQVALRLFEYLGINLTPQERALVMQEPTRDIEALVAYGQGVKSEVNGQYAAAARSFERAMRLDRGFAQAGNRALEVRTTATRGSVASAVQHVNRPLATIPGQNVPGLAVDPGFPGSRATIVVTITQP